MAVCHEHQLLDSWLETHTPPKLEPRDRALARSIALAALRHLGSLRHCLSQFLKSGMPRKSGPLEGHLLAAAAQLLFLDVPDHAAVDCAVDLCRQNRNSASFAGLANAVLRNIIRQRDALKQALDPRQNLPAWLATSWTEAYGPDACGQIAAILASEPSLDLTVKSDPEGWAQKLDGVVLPNGSVRLLTQKPIAELPGYQDGDWWVQDAAASLPARLLQPALGEHIADLCAAPGGKTAQLAQAGAIVFAYDRSRERLTRLHANLQRLKLSATIRARDVLNLDASDGPFDAILLDAPCSATGTIRRHPDVAWNKSPQDVATLAQTQALMLDKALELLKPGGRLVYCVCSLEPQEGPEQIARLLARNPQVRRQPIAAQSLGLDACVTPDGDIRTLPSALPNANPRLAGLDGFFAALLVKS